MEPEKKRSLYGFYKNLIFFNFFHATKQPSSRYQHLTNNWRTETETGGLGDWETGRLGDWDELKRGNGETKSVE